MTPMRDRHILATLLLAAMLPAPALLAQRGAAPQPPAAPRAAALIDLTGYWVSLVTEDWRYRQFTPPKGDYTSVPVTPAARKIADAWDAARDEAAGEQCKAYGAAGLMRVPTRLHITWQDDVTLKIEADAGTQTRVLGFGKPAGTAGDRQGVSAASWDFPRTAFPGRGGGLPGGPSAQGGSLKVVTTKMRPGYLRKNGIPHSENAVLTEYFDRLDVPGGDALLIVVSELVDQEYLTTPYWTSTHFKRQSDASGWNPTPCTSR